MKNKLFYILLCLMLIVSSMSFHAHAQRRIIRIDLPSGATVSSPTLDTDLNNDDVGIVDFGQFPARRAILTGQVFFDSNKNGVKDEGEEGLPDSTVIVKTEFDGEFEILTNEDGEYSIELYADEIVEVFLLIKDEEGNEIEFELTTGSLAEVINLDENVVTVNPVGIFNQTIQSSSSVSSSVSSSAVSIDVPKVVTTIVKVVRTGGSQVFYVPFVLLILLLLLYRSTKESN